MRFYKRDPDAAIAGMAELNLEERGAYNSIIDQAYSRDGILPDDDRLLARMLGCHIHKWRRIRTRLMALGKIWVVDGRTLGVTRVDHTLEEARQFSKLQADRARIRWEKHNKINGTAHASAAIPLIDTATATIKKDKSLAQLAAQQFENLWQTYPKKKSKRTAEKAYLKAIKLTSHEKIVEALERAKQSDHRFREAQFTPYLASWLNAGGWEDEAEGQKTYREYRPPGWTAEDEKKLIAGEYRPERKMEH
jgi:uncharacterized protein YdaU (DUF1376 family)